MAPRFRTPPPPPPRSLPLPRTNHPECDAVLNRRNGRVRQVSSVLLQTAWHSPSSPKDAERPTDSDKRSTVHARLSAKGASGKTEKWDWLRKGFSTEYFNGGKGILAVTPAAAIEQSNAHKNPGSHRVFRGRRTFDPTLCRIPGIKGLKNLGNTCFVNSVLQNISNLPPVRDYLLRDIQLTSSPSSTSISASSQTSQRGALTEELNKFVRKMWLLEGEPVLNPKTLFGELCSRVPRFGHRQQQDAVEALRYLFDGLDNEALKVEAARQTQNETEDESHDESSCTATLFAFLAVVPSALSSHAHAKLPGSAAALLN